ncbi:MAG: rhodanese-like domain-containing protein [Pirellulaceae bacterium]|nr:rhodanese-like domain-containing protein [Pirellulaceae bacterium]
MLDEQIDVLGVKKLQDSGADFLLLDCRNPEERELVSIEASVFIPMGELSQRVAELEEHREKHVVVYCHHGGRSDMVCNWLRAQGFLRVQNMQGGIDAWACHVAPELPRY